MGWLVRKEGITGAVKECWCQQTSGIPGRYKPKSQHGWAQPFVLWGVITLPFRQSCTYLPSKHQTPVHFINRQVLGRDTTSSFHEHPGYPVNTGNKGFSLDRTTSGLNVTVMSTLSCNSAEVLLCDSLFCSLITNSRNTNSNISVQSYHYYLFRSSVQLKALLLYVKLLILIHVYRLC